MTPWASSRMCLATVGLPWSRVLGRPRRYLPKLRSLCPRIVALKRLSFLVHGYVPSRRVSPTVYFCASLEHLPLNGVVQTAYPPPIRPNNARLVDLRFLRLSGEAFDCAPCVPLVFAGGGVVAVVHYLAFALAPLASCALLVLFLSSTITAG
jgi:hypothetical protein